MTQTITDYNHTVTEDVVATDDPGLATHIVLIPNELRGKTTPQAYVMEARIEGREIQALCGYVWIPQRDPKQYPICEGCLSEYKNSDKDDRDRMPDA